MKIYKKLRVNYEAVCSRCGYILGRNSDKYCGNCGAKFAEKEQD